MYISTHTHTHIHTNTHTHTHTQAFGIGALEEDDDNDDVYGTEAMTSYDATLAGEGDITMERKYGWTGGQDSGELISMLTLVRYSQKMQLHGCGGEHPSNLFPHLVHVCVGEGAQLHV